MSADRETLAVYDGRSDEYAAMTGNEPVPGREEFAAALPAGGQILDLGCGPAMTSRHFMDLGFVVDAVDASSAMVAAAQKRGVAARQATFDDISGTDIYDGVWANFSLLHAPRADFPGHLAAIKRALKPGGIFHVGLKLGTGEARDRLGRFYTFYTESELLDALGAAGFSRPTSRRGSGKGLDGSTSKWIWIQSYA